ncbi:MAG: SDR family oxidoreductase [Oscillospiraceae bacterium]|jgi:3-oxoacyl-[acyl-carrier protein] reductase|nr:SDR family oxidoreductase [Oscillospiraceae bacterium]
MGILEGRVAIVAGSGQGIGRAIAIKFAQEGAKVVTNNTKKGSLAKSMVSDEAYAKLTDEQKKWFQEKYAEENGDAETTAEKIRSLGGEATACFADITKEEDAKRLVETAVNTYGRIDIVCNVAGRFAVADIEDITEELWDKIFDVKPKGYFFIIKHAVPYMKKQGYGRILNASSPAFMGDVIKHAEYCASNAGVVGLTRGIAKELWTYGIRANTFCPAARTRAAYEIETLRQSAEAEGKSLTAPGTDLFSYESNTPPENVAPFVTWLASDKSDKVSGTTFIVIGNMVGMVPDPTMFSSNLIMKPDFNDQTPWEIDEIAGLAEERFFSNYRSIADPTPPPMPGGPGK